MLLLALLGTYSAADMIIIPVENISAVQPFLWSGGSSVQSAIGDPHDKLINLNWSRAGHIIDMNFTISPWDINATIAWLNETCIQGECRTTWPIEYNTTAEMIRAVNNTFWLNASNLSGAISCSDIYGNQSDLCTIVDTDTHWGNTSADMLAATNNSRHWNASDLTSTTLNVDYAYTALGVAPRKAAIDVRSNSDGYALNVREPYVGDNEGWQIGVDSNGNLNFYDSLSSTDYVEFTDGGGSIQGHKDNGFINFGGQVFGNTPTYDVNFYGYHARGTSAAPSATQKGDYFFVMQAQGYDTGLSTGGQILALAGEEWGTGGDSSDAPVNFIFQTSGDGAQTLQDRQVIFHNGNITFDAGTLAIDAANNRVGIGLTTPSESLTILADGTSKSVFSVDDAGGATNFQVYTDSDGDGIGIVGDTSGTTKVQLHSNGNSYFNGGNLGIGTTSPAQKLDILTAGWTMAVINGTAATLVLDDYNVGPNLGRFRITSAGGALYFRNMNSDNTIKYDNLLVFGSTGLVGMGVAAADGKLHVMTDSAGSVTASALANDLVVEGATTPGISILSSGGANDASLYLGQASDNDAGRVLYRFDDASGGALDLISGTMQAQFRKDGYDVFQHNGTLMLYQGAFNYWSMDYGDRMRFYTAHVRNPAWASGTTWNTMWYCDWIGVDQAHNLMYLNSSTTARVWQCRFSFNETQWFGSSGAVHLSVSPGLVESMGDVQARDDVISLDDMNVGDDLTVGGDALISGSMNVTKNITGFQTIQAMYFFHFPVYATLPALANNCDGQDDLGKAFWYKTTDKMCVCTDESGYNWGCEDWPNAPT